MRDKSAGSSPDNNNFITSIKIRLRNPMERYTDKDGAGGEQQFIQLLIETN